MYVYLAGPIDFTTEQDSLREKVKLELGAWSIAHFDPSTAFGGAQHDAQRVFETNEAVIDNADGVIAVWPDGVQSVGTPMEILVAHQKGLPVVVIGCDRSMQLKAMGIEVWPFQSSSIGPAVNSLRHKVDPHLAKDEQLAEEHSRLAAEEGLVRVLAAALQDDAYTSLWERLQQRLHTKSPLADFASTSRVWWTGDQECAPSRSYGGDAGFDLVCSQTMVIAPQDFVDIPCGINIQLPPGVWAMVTGRSSTLRRYGLLIHQGIIDNGWRGPLFAGCFNLSCEARTIHRGQRVAQLIPLELLADDLTFQWREDLEPSERGEKGFGSTGT